MIIKPNKMEQLFEWVGPFSLSLYFSLSNINYNHLTREKIILNKPSYIVSYLFCYSLTIQDVWMKDSIRIGFSTFKAHRIFICFLGCLIFRNKSKIKWTQKCLMSFQLFQNVKARFVKIKILHFRQLEQDASVAQ